HIRRLANESGASGELSAVADSDNWYRRPKGNELKILLEVLLEKGISIKARSFDAISLPSGFSVDFSDRESIASNFDDMCFIEIKTASQNRVKSDFSGFFFALTENEIMASKALGERHRVALYNKHTGNIVLTTVSKILDDAKSTTWQVSVQL
ncbi:MAG TPA: hypothetical protein VFM61_00750, partial [Pseudidiomarina sp.]|nr:hypothetical protein [Pseudidiomarina sp.]